MIGLPNLNFSITVSALDCTGCKNCVSACPGLKGNKALKMRPVQGFASSDSDPEAISFEDLQVKFNYAENLPEKEEILQKFSDLTIKGSQFKKPLLEFSGACAGCGETPYAKLATQLFGDSMIIANATGCSSIWSTSSPSVAYTTNHCGKGPAWHNSLFEDDAEFGYGMALAQKNLRKKLIENILKIETDTQDTELKNLCQKYMQTVDNTRENAIVSENLISYLKNSNVDSALAEEIIKNKRNLSKKSIWLFGGDGWAYDIGFGGLDHVLASGENVNVLVFDTEVYSNTGGQASKATPSGSVAQFAISGKKTPKKDLASMMMTYGYIYVAKVALGADYNQCIKAFAEAESYNGPSLIIAYSPCINHGLKQGMEASLESAKLAVESGYWELLRFDPREKEKNKNPLKIDSKTPEFSADDFYKSQRRFNFGIF